MPATKKFKCKLSALLIALGLLSALQPAQARLGEDFNAYRAKIASSFVPSGMKDNNYFFNLNVTPQQSAASPGYAGALRIVVNGGKIQSQTLAIRMGSVPITGATMATVHGLMFSYEALGRQAPKDQTQLNNELKAFGGAIQQAYTGHAQNIRYPNNPGLIKISKSAGGDFLIECSLASAPPAASAKPPVANSAQPAPATSVLTKPK